MSQRGQTRSFGDVGSMSGLPESGPQRLTTVCRMSAAINRHVSALRFFFRVTLKRYAFTYGWSSTTSASCLYNQVMAASDQSVVPFAICASRCCWAGPSCI